DRSEYILPASRIPPPPVTDLDSALTAALHAPLAPEDAVRILEREAERLALLPWSALLLSRMGPERVREAEIAAALPSLSRSRSDRSEYILPASRIPPPPVTDLDSALTAALHAPLAPEDAVRILEREAERLALLPWSALLLSRMGPERVREAEIAAALPSLSRS